MTKVRYTVGPILLAAIMLSIFGTCTAVAENTAAGEEVSSQPLIALIIDDMGNQRLPGLAVIALEGPVTCAIMPHTSYSTFLAERAFAAGKEVMLHQPMQPVEMQRIAGPGEISLDTNRAELAHILEQNLRSVPHTTGINNHMGSLITRHPGHMRWLMEELAIRGNLFFVDSVTTADSVAYASALEAGIPAARRTIFLDNIAEASAIAGQFRRLKKRALAQGYAIGIGHPYPATLEFLQRELQRLPEQGFQLVPLSAIIELLQQQESLQYAEQTHAKLAAIAASR